MPLRTKELQWKYQREWKAARRAAWLKEHGPCKECGSWDQLQVDHVDSSKKVDHKVWSWSTKRREAELSKCQVLCRDCHKKKTALFDRKQTMHGKLQMYDKYKCRCPECTDAKRRHNAKRYAREA